MWLTDDQQRLWRSYLEMVSKLQAAMNRQLQRDCQLSLADYDVLVTLAERGGMRVFELAAALSWEQSRLSHQLTRMRARALVDRHGSADDRRGATVAITDGGRAALAAAAPGHAELVRSTVFDRVPPAQLRAFGAVVETILQRLEEPVTSPTRRSG